MTKTLQQVARETMRGCAKSYRWWIHPKRFDGTAATYNRNIDMACKCLTAAKDLRKLSHEK